MRRFSVCLALASVALAVACNDDAIGPERYGSIVVRVVPADTPVAAAPAAEAPAQEPQTNPAGKPDLKSREGAEAADSPGAPARVAKSPAAAAALDRVEVSVSGPTPKSVDLTLNGSNWEGTVGGLDAGTYSVVIKGYVNSEVDSYGETSGVQVRAGQQSDATINNWGTFQPVFNLAPSTTQMLRFTVGFEAVSTATGYDLQIADNAGFSSPQTINTTQTTVDVGQVPGAGEYHLRVRAKNGDVAAGRWSDEAVVVVEADTIGTGIGPAAFVGFGNGINGRRETTNILPASDQDWYRFEACRMDTLTAETFAQRLTPASDLNTVLTLGSVSPPDTVATNDDADGTDSRLDAVVLPASGEYVVVVTGTGGTIGAYELELTLTPGEFNTGSDCIPLADHVGVTPGASGAAALADTVRFTAVAYDNADQPIPTQPTFAWALSDSSVASIDGDGLVTALADGVTDVIADVDGVSAAGTFTVAQVVTDFSVAPDSALAVSIDEQAQYSADPVDANGYTVASATVDWASDDTTVATVDAAGLATAVANGSAWLVATSGAFSDSAIFAVEQAVASVTLTPDSTGLLSLAGTAQFTAEAFDANGYSLSSQPTFTWGSSDSSIATIDGTGMASAVAVGEVTISASADGITATSKLTIEQVLASVSVTPSGQAIVTPGGTASYSAEALDSLGATVSGVTISWSSLNPEVATVDASGLVTAVASGQALIEADGGGIKGYGVITVGITATPQANLLTSQATGSSAGFNLWPQAADNVWAVGHDGVILHWDGFNWNAETSNTSDSLNAAWGTSATEVFAVGNNGTIVRTDDGGSNWQPMSSPTSERLWEVWGAAPDDVFAVGTGGAIVHYDGSAWTSMTSNTVEDLRAVWGTAWDDVYAVGMNSTLMHYDGSSWGALGGAPAGGYTSIWGFGGDDYWIAGVSGLVAHYTGSWTTETIPTTSNIRGITGTASDDVYAVGGDGLVLRFDGATWDSLPAPTTELLWDVRAAPSGDVFVGGANGVVLRGYRGAQIAFLSEPPSAVDPRTDFGTSVEFRDASGTVITEPTAGTVSLGLSNNAGTIIFLSGGGTPANFWRLDATSPIKGDSVPDPAGVFQRIWASTYDPSTGQVLASGTSGGWGLLAIDPTNGTVTPVGPTPTDLVKGIAWVNGTLWALGAQTATVYELDASTGGMTPIGTVTGTTINGFNGLAVDPTDGTVFAVTNPSGPGSQDRNLVTIDATTFVATEIGPLAQWGVTSLAFMDDGTLLAATGTGAPIPEYLWIVNKADGSMTPMLDATTPSADGLSITAVPARLSGTLDVAAVGGVATFGVQLDAPASGYTLVASYPYLGDTFTGAFDVNVGPAPTTPLYLDVQPNGGTITGINDTLQLQVTPYLYAGGSYQVASGVTVTWSSADSTVAIAEQDGVVTGYGAGVARIDVDEDGGNALSASVDVDVDPSFTGSISASTADFADQLTLTPGSGINWTGAETVTIGGELPYIESQDASQIVLRVPSVPIGDAIVEIANQDAIGFIQYDTISVTSIYTRPADPGNMTADSLLIGGDTTFFISVADSTATSAEIAGPYSVYSLSPSQNTGYTVTMDWQTGADLDMLTADSAFLNCVECGSGLTTNNPEMMEFGVPADTVWRMAFATFLTGQPQTMARVTVVTTPSVGTSMVVGNDHSCMLDLSGNAHCWGSNQNGQLGNGDYGTQYSTTPVAVTGGMTFTALTAGSYHTCGLTESGDAYCWGADWSGQVGDGAAPVGVSAAAASKTPSPDPSRLPRDSTLSPPVLAISYSPTNNEDAADVMPTMVTGGHTYTQLDAGDSHTCGVTTGGDVYCWGYNYYGELGDGTNTNSPSPVAAVNPGVTFTQVAAGAYHTCALTNTGDVYCWGWNTIGQLGDGTQVDANTPQYVGGGAGYTSLLAGYYFSCAVDGSGDLWCWGYNGTGEFGNGGTTSPALTPTAGAAGYGFTRVTAGPDAWGACGITAGNVGYCWGENWAGQLGDGTTSYQYSPVPVSGGYQFVSIYRGSEHTCGATNTGDAYCWGAWQYGELGDGATLPITPQPVLGSTGFTDAAAGNQHTCALYGTDAYCWGYGINGQLGTGTYTTETSPALVVGGYAFASLSAGQYHSCGVDTAGAGYCWGNDYYGTLGDGNFGTSTASPSPVTGGLTWAQIRAGDYRTTCGVTTGSVAYCWGYNNYGQLGHGTVGDSVAAPDSVNLGFTVEQIATGYSHACALTSTSGGDIWCWGRGDDGQLGDGLQTDSPDPVQVDNLGGTLSFMSVRAGQYHTCATTTDNETYCWGYGGHGQIGNDNYSTVLVPTLVSGGHAFDDIQVGRITGCGVEGGSGYCWGNNSYGQLGIGTTDYSTPTPTAIAGGITFDRVVSSGNHSCGTTAGDMYCWGWNYYGQLGLGWLQQELSPVAVFGGIVVRAPSAMPVSTSTLNPPVPNRK